MNRPVLYFGLVIVLVAFLTFSSLHAVQGEFKLEYTTIHATITLDDGQISREIIYTLDPYTRTEHKQTPLYNQTLFSYIKNQTQITEFDDGTTHYQTPSLHFIEWQVKEFIQAIYEQDHQKRTGYIQAPIRRPFQLLDLQVTEPNGEIFVEFSTTLEKIQINTVQDHVFIEYELVFS
ncbi:MAG: hypothetical protein ACMXYF_01465 [Candidatus Woesearchaeota archaeon]